MFASRAAFGVSRKSPAAPSKDAADIFHVVAADWLKRDQKENRSHDEVKRIIDKEVLPTLGRLPIAAITRRQLGSLFDDIADRGAPTLARRCHAHLHRMFRWSVGRGIIETSPMVYLRKPGQEVKRKRVLSDAEIKLLWMPRYGSGGRLETSTGCCC
jgi:integrase